MYDIISNPKGGKGKAEKTLATVKAILDGKGVPYTVHKTEYAGHATEITAELSKKPDTKLIVLGGDGSFHEVLCGITDFDNVTLGLIACGSGNDFIKKTGHEKNTQKALETILRGEAAYYDFIQLEGKRCLNVAGGGMDVDVLLKYASVKKLRGKAAYYYSLFYTLAHTKFHSLRLTLDGVTCDKSVFMIGVGNGGFIGGGLPICPNAKPDDGLLNVVVVNQIPRSKILPLLPGFLTGKHVNKYYVDEYNVREVIIECLDDSKIELDGEIIDDKVLNCRVVHDKLKIYK